MLLTGRPFKVYWGVVRDWLGSFPLAYAFVYFWIIRCVELIYNALLKVLALNVFLVFIKLVLLLINYFKVICIKDLLMTSKLTDIFYVLILRVEYYRWLNWYIVHSFEVSVDWIFVTGVVGGSFADRTWRVSDKLMLIHLDKWLLMAEWLIILQ